MQRAARWMGTAVLAGLVAGCADPGPGGEAGAAGEGRSTGTCPTGKCDGFAETVRDAFDDMRGLKLDDLVGLGVGLATDELNGLLGEVPYADLKLEPTAFFGEPREVFGEVIVQDVDALHAGLTERLGEHAFATRVNGLRRAIVAREGGVYAESVFRIGGELAPAWSMSAGDVVGTVGFSGRPTLEAMVIAHHDDVTEGAWKAPLAAVLEARGFVLPRDAGDVRRMRPGESVALRGEGTLGFNLGVGVPLTIGTVADYVTLSARVSAGARVALSGRLDVQLVRGEGDTAWVDVGVDRQRIRHFSLALASGWGVAGLPEIDLDLGPVRLELAEIAEKALSRQLDDKLSLFSARASRGNEAVRVTVARFRFDLSRDDAAVEQALHQALKGDIRLAQALANRPGSGVIQALDLAKDARSESSYLGFRFLGMSFFTSRNLDTGTVTIDDEGGQQTLLFSELERRSGLFFTDRGTTWRQVTSLRARDGALVDATVNARLTLRERDRFLTKDQILDHVDPLLAWLVGFEGTFGDLGEPCDALFAYADHTCDTPRPGDRDRRAEDEYRACVEKLPETPEYRALVERARRRYGDVADTQLRTGFDAEFPSSAEIARRLFEAKLGLSGIHDRPDAYLDGPKGAMVAQVRFSEAALDSMLAEGADAEFRAALEGVLRLMRADRDDDLDEKREDLDKFTRRRDKDLDAVQAVYAAAVERYRQLDRVAALAFDGRPLGDHAAVVLIPVDAPDDLRLATVAEHQGEVVRDLFTDLTEATRRLREPDGFLVGYALLWMADPAAVEIMVDFQFDPDHDRAYDAWDTRFYTRGTASFIDAGHFVLDELLGSR